MNRLQNTNTVYLANPDTGALRQMFQAPFERSSSRRRLTSMLMGETPSRTAILAARPACAWRINRITRLSEFGTSLDSASATGSNRDQLVIPFLPQGVPAGGPPPPGAGGGPF